MRFAAVLHKGIQSDPTINPAREIVKMVTCDAAAALGVGDLIGSLEAGKRADILLIDLNRPHLVPIYDVYSSLVYTIGRDDVSTALINGKVVMQNRRLMTLDEEETISKVRALAPQVKGYVTSRLEDKAH